METNVNPNPVAEEVIPHDAIPQKKGLNSANVPERRKRSNAHVNLHFPLGIGGIEFDTPNPFDWQTSDEEFEELAKGLASDERLEFRKEFLEKKIQKTQKDISAGLPLAVICFVLAIGIFLPGALAQETKIFTIVIQNYVFYIVAAIFGLLTVAGVIQTFLEVSARGQFQFELDIVKSQQRIAQQLPVQDSLDARGGESTYFDRLVKINVENLSEYYALVKIHTNNSFRASIAAGLVGFAFIIFGLVVGLIDSSNTQLVAVISTAAGVITNFIAGVFFYLYNRTVRQLKSYHDSLLDVQNVLLSFKIIGDMPDDEKKVSMVMSMVSFLIGSKRNQNSDKSPNAETGG